VKTIPRVKVTDEAKKVISELRVKHGALMFHQSGGCCNGSSPIVMKRANLFVNNF